MQITAFSEVFAGVTVPMGHSAGLNFPFLCPERLWASVGLSECG